MAERYKILMDKDTNGVLIAKPEDDQSSREKSNLANMTVHIKAVIDKDTNRVLFVESDPDFVDLLFSFLTLPIATIIRLIQEEDDSSFGCMNNLCRYFIRRDKNQLSSSSILFRSITNLYNSVRNLEAHHLQTEECKNMLLFPRRDLKTKLLCTSLKLNIDEKEPKYFYSCADHPKVFSYSDRLPCDCGSSKLQAMSFEYPKSSSVFVKAGRYVITEGLDVTYGSLDTCMCLFDIHGICNWDRVKHMDLDIGVKEILLLLKCSLFSNTPLTDVILRNGSNVGQENNNNKGKYQHSMGEDVMKDSNQQVTLTLVARKSNNQVLYGKAKEDFIDLLFSFLTFPLGTVIKVLEGSSSMTCFDNLYESIEALAREGQVISKQLEAKLVSPKLPQHFGIERNQLLGVQEVAVKGKLTNPKSANRGETSLGGGFVKGPTFMVSNDLVVTPLCLASELLVLKGLNIPMNDIEERVVTIGSRDALNLLKASLVSKEALISIANN